MTAKSSVAAGWANSPAVGCFVLPASFLPDEGLLRKRTREQNGVTFCDYQAITPEERYEQQQSDAFGDTSPSVPPVHKVNPPGSQSEPHNIKDNIDTRVSKDTLVCANSGGFEAFWTAYPKKKSKGQALSAWKKLKPDSSLQVVILKAIEAQKRSPDWQKDKGQYIPYPATWLNAMAWEDEMPAEQKRREVQYLP